MKIKSMNDNRNKYLETSMDDCIDTMHQKVKTAMVLIETVHGHLTGYYGLEDSAADKVLSTYAKELNENFRKLQSFVDNHNGKEAGRMAHAIKGIFLNIGQKQLAAAAHLLEMELPGEIEPGHAVLVEQLIETLHPLTEIEGIKQKKH